MEPDVPYGEVLVLDRWCLERRGMVGATRCLVSVTR